MRKRYPLAVLLVLVAAIVLTAALATSASALPTFTQAVGGVGPCDQCHTQTDTHAVTSHAPLMTDCSNCHKVDTGTPPTPATCATDPGCHGAVTVILAAHAAAPAPGQGCTTTPGCHGVPPVSGPTITSFTPTSGAVGATVTLTGTGFTGATEVTFNGIAATAFTVVSDTEITVTVPTAASTGPIAVTTPAGTGTSTTDFTVVPAGAPTITSFAPISAGVGATVTLTGTGFTGATALTFNGVAATTFTVVSDTQITAKVPTGATTGPIAVTTPVGTGTSSTNFTVLTATKITLKLAGLELGVLARGHAVTATGRVTPLRTGKVTITLQKKKAGKWVRIKTVTRTRSATGTYKWVYRAGTALSARGYYRMHTTTAKTAKYKAGLSPWRYFRVR